VLKLQLRHKPDRYVNLTSGLITIGRDPANGFVLDGEDISDFHAEVTLEDQRVYVEDLLSSSGTFVNDRRIGSRCELNAWDVIRVGPVELELNDPGVEKPREWTLQTTHPDGSVTHHRLAPNTSIGRDPSCSITLDSDLLSRRHAEVRIAGGHIEVTDLGSANGTYLNGRAIKQASAYAGDEIYVEPYRFLVIGPPVHPIHQDRAERTHLKTSFATSPSASGGRERVTTGSAAAAPDPTELLDATLPQAYLLEQSSLLDEPSITLTGDPTDLGRHPDNHVVLSDRSVSKFHARVEYVDGEWSIEDRGSSNGVKVNGDRSRRITLHDGDTVELGRAVFVFTRPGT
jgi:pSer/pThr/pTyr-binding forkhead associated (FHA) protein